MKTVYNGIAAESVESLAALSDGHLRSGHDAART
jgi:hypothetical protein